MKKILVLLLTMSLAFSTAACGSNSNTAKTESQEPSIKPL